MLFVVLLTQRLLIRPNSPQNVSCSVDSKTANKCIIEEQSSAFTTDVDGHSYNTLTLRLCIFGLDGTCIIIIIATVWACDLEQFVERECASQVFKRKRSHTLRTVM